MLTISDPDAHGVVTVEASGVVSRADCERALVDVERLLDTHGRLSVLVDAVGVSTWEIGAGWQELALNNDRRSQLARVAVLGDKRWEEWASRASARLGGADARFFAPSHADEARAWVQPNGD